ncbi:helix-turn-helix domain-containing protein [Clostridium psychrophilum]|uniref:helix-turn-helix domain-containing protein n=1 Tax=Clostridium psychrophilum TaxID=132926 RepID=UPI001C0B307B|nr:helix-turn-helix domain-containing protein [Clostridium psychrophilum]MBU3179731.1 helix-turn-helix domain-containing protein [Clostridium psychrophilum]
MIEDNKENGKIENVEKIENINDDEIMTIGEIAAYLKISEQIIINLVKNGEIASFKIGGHYRVKKRDIGDFIESLRQGKRV